MDERRAFNPLHPLVRVLSAVAWALTTCAFVGVLGTASGAEAAPALPIRVAHPDIVLAGMPNRFDYESVDPRHRLLFIAHLGSGIVTVVDLRSDDVVANIDGVPGVHGVLAVPSLNEAFATATNQDAVDIISEHRFRIIARAPAGRYPDGMAFAPSQHKLFISDEVGQTETVLDTRTNTRLATIALGGEVGNSQYDPVSHLILVDVQTRDEIVAISPRTDSVVHRYHLPVTCRNDHGLLLDSPARLAFVACDGNAKLLVVDLNTMRVLSVHKTGRGPDVLAFDAGLQRLYVASESGVVAIFRLEGNRLRLLGRRYFAHDAHSVAVDPATHRVYFPLENVGGVGVLRVMKPVLTGARSSNGAP